MHNTNEWFTSWFDSPYYHSLYAHRDHREAEDFISRILSTLQPAKDATILDVGCGRGRHAIEFQRHGYNVTGIDLSPENIRYAKQQAAEKFEQNSPRFLVKDMRKPLDEQFSYIFNLFTSFGYFKDPKDNIRTLQAFRTQLAPNGVGVIDYLNPKWAIDNLKENEQIEQEGILFDIQRSVDKKWIFKDIRFKVNNQDYAFREQVELLELSDFISLFAKTDLQLVDFFGDYELNSFNVKHSNRQILIYQ